MESFLNFLLTVLDKVWPFAVVDPWERAVRVRFGRWVKAKNPGTYLRFPLGIDEFHAEPVVVQVVDLPEITVETSDRVAILLSVAVRYKVTDIVKALVEVQEFEDSMLTDVTMIVTKHINETPYTDITVDNLVRACQPQVKRMAPRWGCEVEAIGCNSIAKHRVYRLVTT